jgi:hypothetical protein
MEEREAAEASSDNRTSVSAAEHLRGAGWWGLETEERSALAPLVRAGLHVGVNVDFHRLGLKPALVLGRVKGGGGLWDIAGRYSFAFRSYHSSYLGDVMLAVPPIGVEQYRGLWQQRTGDGILGKVTVRPLEDIRFLVAPVSSFNAQRRSFDFAWNGLPPRPPTPSGHGPPCRQPGPGVIDALNFLLEDPTPESLEEFSTRSGVDRRVCAESLDFVREFPLGWGFRGPRPGESGFAVFCHALKGDSFDTVRANVSTVPFAVLEAWGEDADGFHYFAEFAVPGEALSETMEHLGRVAPLCGDSFSVAFFESSRLQSYPLTHRASAQHPRRRRDGR